MLNEVGFVWEVDRATSRQLKGAVLKTNDTQERTSFTSSTAAPLKQPQHIILSEQTSSSSTDLQNDTVPDSSDPSGLSNKSEGSPGVNIAVSRQPYNQNGWKTKNFSHSGLARVKPAKNGVPAFPPALASTYSDEPPGNRARKTEARGNIGKVSKTTWSQAAERNSSSGRRSNLEPARKRVKSSLAKTKDTSNA